MHGMCGPHKKEVDLDNLQFEKGGWKHATSYALSKLLAIMWTNGFHYVGK